MCWKLGHQKVSVDREETFKNKAYVADVAHLVKCLPGVSKRPWVLSLALYNLDLVTHTWKPTFWR